MARTTNGNTVYGGKVIAIGESPDIVVYNCTSITWTKAAQTAKDYDGEDAPLASSTQDDFIEGSAEITFETGKALPVQGDEFEYEGILFRVTSVGSSRTSNASKKVSISFIEQLDVA